MRILLAKGGNRWSEQQVEVGRTKGFAQEMRRGRL